MAILKKTTVVAKPAAKAMMKARAEEMFKAGKPVVKSTLQKTMVDTKNGKVIKVTKSAPIAVKMKSITEKEFNTDGKAAKPMAKKEPTFKETMNRKFKQGDAYAMAKNAKNLMIKPAVKAIKAKYDEVFGETPKPKIKK